MPIRVIINKLRKMLRIDSKSFPEISTARLCLRQLSPDDAPAIFALRTDPEVNQYLERPLLRRLEEAQDVIQSLNQGVANNSWIFWAIALKDNNQLIGTICIWNISRINSSADIGYELLPGYQGKGIMQEALSQVLDFGFQKMQLNKLQAFTHKNNNKSLQLLQKNGFSRDEQVEEQEHAGEKGLVVYSRERLRR